MTGALTHSPADRQAAELARLVGMVRLSAHRHSFAIVECNSPALRDSLLARLVDQLPGLRVVRVTKETYSILDTVVAELGTDRPPAVIIVGIDTLLEGVQRHEPALSRLNYSRDGWREELSCPTVFWLPTFAAIALTRDCGDLLRMIPAWYHFEVESDVDRDRVLSPRQGEELTIAPEEDRRERAPNSFAMVPLRPETRNQLEEFEQALDRGDTSGAQLALQGMGDIVGAAILREELDGDSWDRLAYFESAARLHERSYQPEAARSNWKMATRIAAALLEAEGSLATYRHSAWTWRQLAANEVSHGLNDQGRESLERARGLLEKGLAKHAQDPNVGSDWHDLLSGDFASQAAKMAAAIESPRQTRLALQLLKNKLYERLRLHRAHSDVPDYERDLAICRGRVGELLLVLGNLSAAEHVLRASLESWYKLAKLECASNDEQRSMAAAHNQVGDVYRAQGNLPGALREFEAGKQILERLTELDPANTRWQRDLSVSHNKIGGVYQAQGNLPGALREFTALKQIMQRLTELDPANLGWQRDLSVSHNKIGGVYQAQGNLPGALREFETYKQIMRRLTDLDPANTDWQRELSVSHNRIGDVYQAQGNLPTALREFEAYKQIMQRMTELDPANTGWQRDLSVSHNCVGDVYRAQGNLPGALREFEALKQIMQRLTQLDPANTGWQCDLSVSHNKIGGVYQAQGNLPGALREFEAYKQIMQRLTELDPANTDWQRELSVSHNNMGGVYQTQGNLPGALREFEAAKQIMQQLTELDPANTGWQRDLAVSLAWIGSIQRRSKQPAEARAALIQARDLLKDIVQIAPDHTAWRSELVAVESELLKLK